MVCSLMTMCVQGQNIVGDWMGALKLPGVSLRLVLHISQTDEGGYAATLDSPDQNAKGMPVSTTSFAEGVLKIAMPNLMMEYEGTLQGDTLLDGTFKQMGQTFKLQFKRAAAGALTLHRPQEPKAPFPYYIEEVRFDNPQAGITLAGTLTLPRESGGPYPAVVLISGSGAQNRDEELLGHKPFLVLADYLTRAGFAVLRYDDRGSFASTGDYKTATTFDFSTDAEAALNYLQTRKEINSKQIGFAGHSEGGLIAPMIAARNGDVAFVILLAAPGVRGDQVLLAQQEALLAQSNLDEQTVAAALATNKMLFEKITQSSGSFEQIKAAALQELPQAQREEVGRQLTPWMFYFLKCDPVPYLEKTRCPVLALNGDKDLQVIATQNLPAIREALLKGGNQRVTTHLLPGLNHLFQECTTGMPQEYQTIEQTFSPKALQVIVNWLREIHL
ncbi:MAG: alpha/beta hydrolase [Mediterranea sp.]|nr:alpha/beta hydrolase [Mediterranea sp.]